MGVCVTRGEEADQIHRFFSRVKTAVHGEQGILTCQAAFLHRLPAAVPVALWDCRGPKFY